MPLQELAPHLHRLGLLLTSLNQCQTLKGFFENFMQGLNAALLLQAAPDFIRSVGKIYVVVAVIVIVLLGFFVYLYFVDRRLTKLEEQIQDDE